MNFLRDKIALVAAAVIAAVVLAAIAILAPARLRAAAVHLRRWIWALCMLATVLICVFLQIKYPQTAAPDSALPPAFRPYFWYWVMLATLGFLGSATLLWRGLSAAFGRLRVAGPLDEVWTALLTRLRQARVEMSRRRVNLILAPDHAGEALAPKLINSGDLHLITDAPAGPGPVHAYAIGDGERDSILLSCDGAWSSGLLAEGAARVADLGSKLKSQDPNRPIVSGVVLLCPFEWADRAEAVDHAAVAGEAIQVLYQALQVRCPVLALFCGLEAIPGAPEFIRRMTAVDRRKTEARAGFEVPVSKNFDRKLARRAMDWIATWFHNGVLDLLVADLFEYRGNAELIRFDQEFRRRRRRLVEVLEAALSTYQRDDEIVMFRGGYFTAIGDEPGASAFAPGLFHGLRAPILAERREANWTQAAIRGDKQYRTIALGMALVSALAAGLAWWAIALRIPILGWAGLLTFAVIWAIVLLAPVRARKPVTASLGGE
jgi:hypothetical protein